jgi:hypothetical protein
VQIVKLKTIYKPIAIVPVHIIAPHLLIKVTTAIVIVIVTAWLVPVHVGNKFKLGKICYLK